jgi:hypothetical protein
MKHSQQPQRLICDSARDAEPCQQQQLLSFQASCQPCSKKVLANCAMHVTTTAMFPDKTCSAWLASLALLWLAAVQLCSTSPVACLQLQLQLLFGQRQLLSAVPAALR